MGHDGLNLVILLQCIICYLRLELGIFPSDIVDNCTLVYSFPNIIIVTAFSSFQNSRQLLFQNQLGASLFQTSLLSAVSPTISFRPFTIFVLPCTCNLSKLIVFKLIVRRKREREVLIHPNPVFCCRLTCPWFFHILHEDL